jgi:hypothetical protein
MRLSELFPGVVADIAIGQRFLERGNLGLDELGVEGEVERLHRCQLCRREFTLRLLKLPAAASILM